MQVIRNIAELAWVPELAQREPWLTWVEAGADAFDIVTDAAGREVRVRFDFSDHRDFDGVRMLAHVVATYEFEDEPWEDFRAEVVSVYRESAAS